VFWDRGHVDASVEDSGQREMAQKLNDENPKGRRKVTLEFKGHMDWIGGRGKWSPPNEHVSISLLRMNLLLYYSLCCLFKII